MARAGWSSVDTFCQHYYRPPAEAMNAVNFGQAVLRDATRLLTAGQLLLAGFRKDDAKDMLALLVLPWIAFSCKSSLSHPQIVDIRWSVNTLLRMVVLEVQGGAVLGMAWPLPYASGPLRT